MLPFIPRKVAKSLKAKAVTLTSPASPPVPEKQSAGQTLVQSLQPTENNATSPLDCPPPSSAFKGKRKAFEDSQRLREVDYTIMLRLAVTDYAFWSDADLRRTMEFAEEDYIPLATLIDRLPLPDDMPRPSEAALVKAIHAHASNFFDVRMLMSSPSRAVWYGKISPSQTVLGGYEVRLKDAKSTLHRARNSSRNEWEARAIYIENVPPQHRNVSGIYRFVHSLLLDAETDDCAERIQCISLPRHHLDKPGDHPKCKGFALVTLARFEDVDHLLQLWPWERPRTASASRSEKVPQDAERFGFRTTMKLRWDKLNQEYLSYRQELLDQMAQDTAHDDAEPSTSAVSPPNEAAEAERKDTAPDTPVLDLSAPYPSGCLAFVRHVHPETNKTTLRKLLSQAFSKTESGVSDGGIDYVDFNKGMDTCHIRLAAPRYTKQLVRHFSDHPTVQSQGLDGTGDSKSNQTQKPVLVEMVSGQREELYWGKVPEKVRTQAMEKAVSGRSITSSGGEEQAGNGEAKRKRRKRG